MISTRNPGLRAIRFFVSRRAFLGLVAGLATPRWVRAQQAKTGFSVGWLGTNDLSFKEPYSLAFVQRLRELGFVDGSNLSFTYRHADGRVAKFPALAAELVKLKSDVLFSTGTKAALVALTQASRNTPIIFIAVDFDPVTTGNVASLARPGGLVTGVTAVQSQLPGKRLELLKELLPHARKVAVFSNDQTTDQLAVAENAARSPTLAVHVVEFKQPPFDYVAGFADAVRARSQALLVLGSALFVPARRKLPQLALSAKLPSVFHHSQWAEAGGLMSYGFNFTAMWRTGAEILARILRGGKAADIPMEQPTVFELALNRKTAKALGINIPPSLQLRVDRFFE
jgi:putative ABC transport system substrate-binding protein